MKQSPQALCTFPDHAFSSSCYIQVASHLEGDIIPAWMSAIVESSLPHVLSLCILIIHSACSHHKSQSYDGDFSLNIKENEILCYISGYSCSAYFDMLMTLHRQNLQMDLTSVITASFMKKRISSYIHYELWDEITYPLLNFNGATIEV